LNSEAIRRAFVDYFVERGHLHLTGLPLVPTDPSVTTLFMIAGMQQMIPYFLGREKPPSRRMVTVQKAVRTVDIDEVGDDTHLTYLEMLGNFSVGDYFKRGAIDYTWDFLINSMRIPAERWWAATYPDDQEAREAWLEVGMPAERIGEDPDNWWGPPGPYGPCGPNSEIHLDRGERFGCGATNCRPETGCCDRFVEIWNDVFMSFFQEESGERRPLPWNNIDTGMGFERLVAAVQGVDSVYDTDLFQPIIAAVVEQSAVPYGQDSKIDRSLRIISDHCRAITMLISDGVMPASDGRGYVVRRLLRRAALHGRLLGLDQPFLARPVEAVIDKLRGFHQELEGRRRHILQVVDQEERRFLQTLSRGLILFEELAERAGSADRTIPGEDAFALYDTHGFPLEMTTELAQERGLVVDERAFLDALTAQRERASWGAKSQAIGVSPETFSILSEQIGPTLFTGYDELTTITEVAAILADGQLVSRAEAAEGIEVQVEIILAATPFYAESGGQVGDVGLIRGDSGLLRVLDTKRPYAPFIVQRVQVTEGAVSVGDAVEAEVDAARRLHLLPHHSGTHLLHKALQEVLGPEATQAGSLVEPDRLRFDFRWPRPLSDEEIRDVEGRVNAAIWADLPVRKHVMPYAEAIEEGAMALFGEKYGDEVRVVSMGDWSKELCGGTHVDSTGEIGSLLIVSETGIGAGIRRIEAVAGAAAYTFLTDLRQLLADTAETLDTQPRNLVARAQQMVQQARAQDKRLEALTGQLAGREAESLLESAIPMNGMVVIARQVAADTPEYLQVASDAVKSRIERGIIVLATVVAGKPAYTMAVTPSVREEGYSANDILRSAARVGQGGAGGTAEFAKGGGGDAAKVDDVLRAAVELVRQRAEG